MMKPKYETLYILGEQMGRRVFVGWEYEPPSTLTIEEFERLTQYEQEEYIRNHTN